jgi:cell division protease FtsH
MSQLGPLTFGKKEEQIFLGREISQHRDYSEDTAIKIDQEVRRLVDTGYKSAVDIIVSKREYLDKIAQALLEREVIDANDIKMILEGKELPTRIPPSTPPDDGVQQVLKPEGARAPSVKPGEHPAQA